MAAQFGSRLRKGAATTAAAALAVAALSASQAPGATTGDTGRQANAGASTSAPDGAGAADGATGNSPYYTDLPPLNSPNPSASPTAPSSSIGTAVSRGAAEAGIPATVLDAYKKAEAELRASKPGCNLPWQLLAAIGKVESGQARGGDVDAEGNTLHRILGPELDGNGFALIQDTDGGKYDGNSQYDQAVGPMQFIPSTWAWAGRDGNGDGVKDPNNVYDAALAAGHYLCRYGWDLSVQADMNSAILSYNNSQAYLNLVMSWYEFYRKGTHSVPNGTGTLPSHRSDGSTGSGSGDGSDGSTTKPTKTTPKPDEPTPSPPSTPTLPPTATDTVDHLEAAGTATLTAMAGGAFDKQISTRAETKAGRIVAKIRVRFTIVGDTDATFAGGETVATVVTDSKGVAVAPALQAGEKTGDFTVHASVVGRTVKGVDYDATVTARAADTLALANTTAPTCTPGGEFTDQVQVKATYQGAAAGKVAATATLVKSADDTGENDKGPYFKDANGNAVRTLADLQTDANGLLTLPKLYADDTTGTFLLRITTTGGATLTVELTVAAADPSSSPSPSASPSASASATASASPSASATS
ncbi:lytic transglycosylase domain-containing protein [Streptomyces hyaluromycini]|uniref:lytic transglycosylase domain-containing protein n=1 Tax=Streptomyces hyaluromycini TaxID=1377993 RepID=UPI000B5C8040|nr:lytic transglycosylase domain-containing protein [Streptomyces hyaluromycini]